MSTAKIELARALAEYAHEGQIDKAGAPYFTHPLAVSEMVQTEEEKIVALLHDVLEDTSVTEPTIRNLFGDEIAEAVLSVTRRDGEDYMDFIARAKQNPIGRTVKLADLHHNMDLSRIPDPQPRDFERLEKYRQAEKLLLS